MKITLAKEQRIRVLNSESLFKVMEQILKSELIDRDRKQCFVVSLGITKKILNIELIALGSQESIIIEPLEVFGQSLASRANKIILVLYNGSGELNFLKSEIEFINRIHNCGLILNTELADCLVVNNESYISLREDESLYNELIKSNEFVPAYEIRSQAIKEGWNLGIRIVANNLIEQGIDTDVIVNSTHLDSIEVRQMRAKRKPKRK